MRQFKLNTQTSEPTSEPTHKACTVRAVFCFFSRLSSVYCRERVTCLIRAKSNFFVSRVVEFSSSSFSLSSDYRHRLTLNRGNGYVKRKFIDFPSRHVAPLGQNISSVTSSSPMIYLFSLFIILSQAVCSFSFHAARSFVIELCLCNNKEKNLAQKPKVIIDSNAKRAIPKREKKTLKWRRNFKQKKKDSPVNNSDNPIMGNRSGYHCPSVSGENRRSLIAGHFHQAGDGEE